METILQLVWSKAASGSDLSPGSLCSKLVYRCLPTYVCLCVCICWYVSVLLATWNHSWRVGVTPQVIMKGGAEDKKIHFGIPTPTLNNNNNSNLKKKVLSGLMDAVGGWRKWFRDKVTLHCVEVFFFGGLFDRLFPWQFCDNPKDTYPSYIWTPNMCTHVHTHSLSPCTLLQFPPALPAQPWEQEHWLLDDINNWETCCTHPVYYWASDVCKEHNVSCWY